MISYIEKGDGLHQKIRAAGHTLERLNDIWISDNDPQVQIIINSYTLDECKDFTCTLVEIKAKQLRDYAVRNVSAGEMASWPVKQKEADAYTKSKNPEDAPMLQTEANIRGVSLAALVEKVYTYAQQVSILEAYISGACGKHKDIIRSFNTFEKVVTYDYHGGWPYIP